MFEGALFLFLSFFSSLIGMVAGFGASTIMVPISLYFLSLPETLLFVGIIQIFIDFWLLVFFGNNVRWKLVVAFGIPGVLASYVGARLVFGVSATFLAQALGVILITYVIFVFMRPKFRLKPRPRNAEVGGLLSGLIAGTLGIGGSARGVFLSAFNLPKATYLATAGVIALVIDSVRLATYFSEGVRFAEFPAEWLLIFVPMSLFGALLGRRVVNKVPQKRFRFLVSVFLLIIGLKLLFIPF